MRCAAAGCLSAKGKYRHADLELARKNFHMTTVLAATLAQRNPGEELVLFHVSERYQRDGWMEMLMEGQASRSKHTYPPAWGMG